MASPDSARVFLRRFTCAPLQVSGLLALPKPTNVSSVALIAYQHGTVWGKYEVPSYAFRTTNPGGYPRYDAAYETRYMVGLFAGNGSERSLCNSDRRVLSPPTRRYSARRVLEQHHGSS